MELQDLQAHALQLAVELGCSPRVQHALLLSAVPCANLPAEERVHTFLLALDTYQDNSPAPADEGGERMTVSDLVDLGLIARRLRGLTRTFQDEMRSGA